MSALITRNPIAIRQLMNETLYKDKVVAIEHQPENEPEQPLKFLGANGKGILFLLDNPQYEYLSKEAEEAFLRTLTALKLFLDDIALLNLRKCGQGSIEELKKFFHPKVCIFLGREAWKYEHPLHETFQQEGIMMLNTYNFEEMLHNDEKKRAFWKAIKKLEVLS